MTDKPSFFKKALWGIPWIRKLTNSNDVDQTKKGKKPKTPIQVKDSVQTRTMKVLWSEEEKEEEDTGVAMPEKYLKEHGLTNYLWWDEEIWNKWEKGDKIKYNRDYPWVDVWDIVNKPDDFTVNILPQKWREKKEKTLNISAWWLQILSEDKEKNVGDIVQISFDIWETPFNLRWKIARIVYDDNDEILWYWLEFLYREEDLVQKEDLIKILSSLKTRKEPEVYISTEQFESYNFKQKRKAARLSLSDMIRWTANGVIVGDLLGGAVKNALRAKILDFNELWIRLSCKNCKWIEWDKVGLKLILWEDTFHIKGEVVSSSQKTVNKKLIWEYGIKFSTENKISGKNSTIKDSISDNFEKRGIRMEQGEESQDDESQDDFTNDNVLKKFLNNRIWVNDIWDEPIKVFSKTWARTSSEDLLLNLSAGWLLLLSWDTNKIKDDIIVLSFKIWLDSINLKWRILRKVDSEDWNFQYWIEFLKNNQDEEIKKIYSLYSSLKTST